jgi:signal transduction histidine kinase/CheY-like chemotaxis protein/HAMP domain-containing protein
MGIRSKLNIIVALTALGPLLIAILITNSVSISQRREIIGNTYQQLSEKARDSIVIMLKQDIGSIQQLSVFPTTREFLKTTSKRLGTLDMSNVHVIDNQWKNLPENDPIIEQILNNELAVTLKAFKIVEGSFGEVFVTDSYGRLVASSNKTTDYWQADEEWWQKAYKMGEGQTYLSNFGYDESSKVHSLDICIPVSSDEPPYGVIGIIKGVLDISHFFDAIENTRAGEGGKVAMLSDSGKILTSRNEIPIRGQTNKTMIPSQKMGDSGWFLAKGEDDKPDMLVGFAKIAMQTPEISFNTTWSIVAYQPASNAFAPVRKLIWLVSMPGLILILCSFFVGLYIAQKVFIAPLSQLTQMAKMLPVSDLRQKVQVKSKDEIGQLAESFNQMASILDVQSSINKLAMNMLSNLNLTDVLNTVVENLKLIFGADAATIWLVDDRNIYSQPIQTNVSLGDGDEHLHLSAKSSALDDDIDFLRDQENISWVSHIAEKRNPSQKHDFVRRKGASIAVSSAGYPLIMRDELLGVLALFNCRRITFEEFNIIGSFAGRTAMAIQNARLLSTITELNLNLEQKVKERTYDLELANAKLRKADRMKSEFLANMSHELRTPLNAIIGFAEILRDGVCGELTDTQKSAVIDIYESGKHLLQMINDILDLSKVEAGKMELQSEEFSLVTAIEEIHSIVKDMVNKKGLNITFSVPDELPNAYADQIKFKQIMYNLLSNAIKFTPQGGIEVNVAYDDSQFTISVADTGIGIDPEYQEVIFDEFKQLDSSQSRQYEGTGLGLTLTKRLVELHNGKIWVESGGLGKGSKFLFTIPRRHAEIEAYKVIENHTHESLFTKPSEKSKGKTILIVEDNVNASQLLRIYLTDAGYDTYIATDGEEAIAKAKEIKPFAITLDIMLPKKDGWQIMQELKNFPETQDIPVIIVSIVDDQNFGFSMGAVGYLVKPIDKDQLISILDKLEISLQPQNNKPNILIIDDNHDDIKLMESILSSEGFGVLNADNGSDGIKKAIKAKPDLIILDLIMPKVSGFDVIKSLQDHPEARKIPIIISSIKELTAEDRERLNSKVKSIVQKGEDAKTHILEAIKQIEAFHKAGD